MLMKNIYFDHAATTKPKEEVIREMLPYLDERYGNPSATYGLGMQNKGAIAFAREKVAMGLGCDAKHIYFTSGGTEADNWALIGVAEKNRMKGNHIITTKIEHHAVLNTCKFLERKGFEITYLDVDKQGIVSVENLANAIRPTTILISVMFANNEIGTMEPIKEIGKITRRKGIIFHTDGVQAYGQTKIDVDEYGFDLFSGSSHKIYGPKGIGFLYIRDENMISGFIHGGMQEKGMRAGTENVAAIVGFGKAAELAQIDLQKKKMKKQKLRDYMVERIINEIPYTKINGDYKHRLANNANISFSFVQASNVKTMLDNEGIYVSTGAACTSREQHPSHVLQAIGCSEDEMQGAIRITVGEENTKEEIDYFILKLKEIIDSLRRKSLSYGVKMKLYSEK